MTPGTEEGKKPFLPALPDYLAFPIFFLISYGSWGTVNAYFPVYFNSFGYSNTQIGVLSAVGPFAAFFGLLFWGARADRARYRNNVLLFLIIALGAISQLYLLNGAFYYTFALSVVFMFCFYPMGPVGEAMFIEHAQSGKVDFGKGRVWGSFGLALLPLLPGLVISNWGIRNLFPAYLVLTILLLFITLQLPRMRGGQSVEGKKTNILQLRHDKEFVGLICFLFFLHMTLGFYYSFFPVYMDNVGATDIIGVNNLAQFGAEFILVYFIVRIIKRFGFAKLHVFAFILTAARMLLIGFVTSPVLLLIINLIGGLGYSMCMMLFTFFALRAPKELRTSAQMLVGLVAHTISRFLGSIIGGALSDVIGIPSVFVYAGVFDILLIAGFILWLRKTRSLRDPILM